VVTAVTLLYHGTCQPSLLRSPGGVGAKEAYDARFDCLLASTGRWLFHHRCPFNLVTSARSNSLQFSVQHHQWIQLAATMCWAPFGIQYVLYPPHRLQSETCRVASSGRGLQALQVSYLRSIPTDMQDRGEHHRSHNKAVSE
jgi:hypothetical protein